MCLQRCVAFPYFVIVSGRLALTILRASDLQPFTITEGQGCGQQSINLGNIDSPAACKAAAGGHLQCHGSFMWAPVYWYAWGCRCCAANGGEGGGSLNANWNTYTYQGTPCLPCWRLLVASAQLTLLLSMPCCYALQIQSSARILHHPLPTDPAAVLICP
jgi:hypothetical protein